MYGIKRYYLTFLNCPVFRECFLVGPFSFLRTGPLSYFTPRSLVDPCTFKGAVGRQRYHHPSDIHDFTHFSYSGVFILLWSPSKFLMVSSFYVFALLGFVRCFRFQWANFRCVQILSTRHTLCSASSFRAERCVESILGVFRAHATH